MPDGETHTEWSGWLSEPVPHSELDLAKDVARINQGVEQLFATGGEMLISNSI